MGPRLLASNHSLACERHAGVQTVLLVRKCGSHCDLPGGPEAEMMLGGRGAGGQGRKMKGLSKNKQKPHKHSSMVVTRGRGGEGEAGKGA